VSAEGYDLSQLLEEREWRRCAPSSRRPRDQLEGFKYFCDHYAYIRHPDRGRIPFEMFDAQVESVQLFLDSRYTLILKARQLGFSTLVSTYALWMTMFYEDRVIIMLSRTEREAIKLLQKAKYVYKFLPEWMKFRGPPMNATQTKMEFANESYIESLPSASDPARGESVYLVIVDELAFLPNSDEAWASIEPIADIGGRVIALSTANGEGNLFHQLWVGAEMRNNRFKSLFFPWSANGRTQEWYEEKKRDLPEWMLASEYPDNPDDAFLKSGRPVFSLDVLRRLPITEPTRGFQVPERRFEFREDSEGPLRVWRWPNAEARYVVGADPSQGMEHGDFSSCHVINARTGEVVAHWHGRIDPDLFGSQVLAPLGRLYNDALMGVESNNHGLTTLKALQRVRYHPLYMQRSPRYKRSVPTDILGWRTTQITKPLAADELNMALRQGDVILHCGDTIAELRTYVRDENNKMTGSPFDDRTVSLMIANQMRRYVWMPEYEVHRAPPPGTWGWAEKQLYGSTPFEKMSNSRRGPEPPRIGDQFARDQSRVVRHPKSREGS
jgi:hypothetical protein